jgi:hypothetical protein
MGYEGVWVIPGMGYEGVDCREGFKNLKVLRPGKSESTLIDLGQITRRAGVARKIAT